MELQKTKKPSFEKMRQMRQSGMSKPKEITWSEWNAPFELSAVQESMCYRHAMGMSIKKVAAEMELSYSHVSITLSSDICKFRVKEMQFQVFGKNHQKRFKSLIDSSIQTVQTIMEDNQNKPSTRLSAANTILDRALGKPTQQIEVRDSSIRDIYNKMDELFGEKKKTITVEANNIEDADYFEIETDKPEPIEACEDEKDDVDAWMEKNYGEEKED